MFSSPVLTAQQDIETSMHNTTKPMTTFDCFLGFVFRWSLHNDELSAELAFFFNHCSTPETSHEPRRVREVIAPPGGSSCQLV